MFSKTAQQIYLNRRMLVILLLGFSSGLPLALTGGTLQAWYTVSNIDIVTIGFLSLVGQPYIYKFLWAPFMDRFMPLTLDRRRSWIVIMQLMLAITLAFMAFAHPNKTPWLLAVLAMVVAFFSA